MKLIFHFQKTGRMSYIAHLDLQRALLRVLRMSGLKPAYSEGFNPHPKMSLALPLSLGFESLCEDLEVETERAVDLVGEGGAILSYLNKIAPDGLLFTGLSEKRELAGESSAAARSRKSLASRVTAVDYDLFLPEQAGACANMRDRVSDFLSAESIFVEKKNHKKGTVSSIDIRPQIQNFEYSENISNADGDDFCRFSCTLSAKAGAVLSPLTLIQAFGLYIAEHGGATIDETNMRIVRTKIHYA